MNSYLQLRLLPDPEFPATVLMNALFAKLHRALVLLGQGEIGISFPDVGEAGHAPDGTLGHCLRLHGTAEALARLMQSPWLGGMKDHLAISDIGPIPDGCQHRNVRRVQAKSSPDRERRRLMARQGLDAEAAARRIPDHAAERLKQPYLTLGSQSTGQQFRLFINHCPPQPEAVAGHFNAYGLSTTATVPWF